MRPKRSLRGGTEIEASKPMRPRRARRNRRRRGPPGAPLQLDLERLRPGRPDVRDAIASGAEQPVIPLSQRRSHTRLSGVRPVFRNVTCRCRVQRAPLASLASVNV